MERRARKVKKWHSQQFSQATEPTRAFHIYGPNPTVGEGRPFITNTNNAEEWYVGLSGGNPEYNIGPFHSLAAAKKFALSTDLVLLLAMRGEPVAKRLLAEREGT